MWPVPTAGADSLSPFPPLNRTLFRPGLASVPPFHESAARRLPIQRHAVDRRPTGVAVSTRPRQSSLSRLRFEARWISPTACSRARFAEGVRSRRAKCLAEAGGFGGRQPPAEGFYRGLTATACFLVFETNGLFRACDAYAACLA